KAAHISGLLAGLVAHEGQQFGGRTGILQAQRDRMEAADRRRVGHAALPPDRAWIAGYLDQRQAVTVRPFKTKALLTEALLAADTGRAMVGQPLLPIGESARGYGEHGRCHFARAGAATCDVWKRE